MTQITIDSMLQELSNKTFDIITTTSGYTATLQDVRPESLQRVEDNLHIGGSSDPYDVTIQLSENITCEDIDSGTVYTMACGDVITSFLVINRS